MELGEPVNKKEKNDKKAKMKLDKRNERARVRQEE